MLRVGRSPTCANFTSTKVQLIRSFATSDYVTALANRSDAHLSLSALPCYGRTMRTSAHAHELFVTGISEDNQAIIPPPAPAGPSTRTWLEATSESRSSAELARDVRHRVFCNRSLDLTSCRAIGFDMDYTLAQYKPETFEHLAYAQTVQKLTGSFGYPAELGALEFDWQFMMRGLTIDKERGNVIKIDRHKYVKIAHHGLSPMAAEARKGTYNMGTVRDSLDGDDYSTIDTLFSIAEAYLFMQIVDLKDSGKHPELSGKTYKQMYREIRGAVDLCHRDGSLKVAVASNPAKYIHEDPRLHDMLDSYRLAGRKVFLATNSLWDYTHVVMNYLISGHVGTAKTEEWLEYFDVVFTGCQKPRFFSDRPLLFQVNTADNSLLNTDNGAPILPIDQNDLPANQPHFQNLGTSKVFQGGSVNDLHGMLGVSNAAEVLYVGDHIYGDILRSKKTLGWRTMLVVPELDMELRRGAQSQALMTELHLLRNQRDLLDERIQRLSWDLHGPQSATAGHDDSKQDTDKLEAALARLQEERAVASQMHSAALAAHHRRFHPVWGQLLKAGYQSSKYAHLMERFACLYTSHVSNLAYYSPDRKFRGRLDVMAHEVEVSNALDPLSSEQ